MGTERAIDETKTQSDLVHERLRESPAQRWILLDGNRYVLTALFAGLVFTVCLAIGAAGWIPVANPATATTLVGAIVGGTLPFITIVLAINQLVLSQELGWTGDLQQRYEAMTDFRRTVEDATETPVSPAAPAEFLRLIVDAVVAAVGDLQSDATDADGAVAASLETFAGAVTEEGETVSKALETAEFGTFDALSAVLGHFNGAHLHAARTIRARYADELSIEALEGLDSLIELLGYLAVARQSFKTLYMQHELAHLSKLLLYVGFPTLLGGGLFMMTYPSIIAGLESTLALVVVVSVAVTLAFLPFVVLLVYTFRIATIASKTADFGPFVPRVDVKVDE
ncbi:hypothetical protein ACFQO4_11710 [Saliphagus sp. GCM10025334]